MSTNPAEPEPELTVEQAEQHPIVAEVAKNIRMLAARDDISLTALGEAIGLKQPALSKRMNGTVTWSLTDLLAVARYFRVQMSTIAPDSLTNEVPR